MVLPSFLQGLTSCRDFLAISEGAHPLETLDISAAQQVANHLHDYP